MIFEELPIYKAVEPFFEIEILEGDRAKLKLFKLEKIVRVTKAGLYTNKDSMEINRELAYQIARKKKELVRDFTYMLAGDKFREFENIDNYK